MEFTIPFSNSMEFYLHLSDVRFPLSVRWITHLFYIDKFQKIEFLQNMFFDYSGIKLKINKLPR